MKCGREPPEAGTVIRQDLRQICGAVVGALPPFGAGFSALGRTQPV